MNNLIQSPPKRIALGKIALLVWLFVSVSFSGAQEQSINLGRISFSVTPKLLADGPITEAELGVRYTEKISGELRFRYTKIAKLETLEGVADSLDAMNEDRYDIFLLPFEYSFANTKTTKIFAGAGIYYQNDRVKEKGYFDMLELGKLDPPLATVNSFANDFSLNIAGPLIDAGVNFSGERFSIGLSGGIVPIFYLDTSQETTYLPLMKDHGGTADYTHNTTGSPYFYARADFILFKYFNIVFLYDYLKTTYKNLDWTIDLDSTTAKWTTLNWINPEKTTEAQSFKIEVSLLLPISGGMSGQFGVGFAFDSLTVDSGDPQGTNKTYVIMNVRKAK